MCDGDAVRTQKIMYNLHSASVHNNAGLADLVLDYHVYISGLINSSTWD